MEASAADLQSEEILTRLEVAAARQASYAWGIGFFVFDAIAYACGILHLRFADRCTRCMPPKPDTRPQIKPCAGHNCVSAGSAHL